MHKEIIAPFFADTEAELSETFTVNLSNATNADFSDGQGTGTVLENDRAPAFRTVHSPPIKMPPPNMAFARSRSLIPAAPRLGQGWGVAAKLEPNRRHAQVMWSLREVLVHAVSLTAEEPPGQWNPIGELCNRSVRLRNAGVVGRNGQSGACDRSVGVRN